MDKSRPPKLSSSHTKPPRTPAPKTVKRRKAESEPSAPPTRALPQSRCGTVAIVGPANVGKSTLVNALVGFRLSIVTSKPQTTRDRILGVLVREPDPSKETDALPAQLVFLDTPGLHRARNKLGAQMNAHAEEAARRADVVVYVTEPIHPTDQQDDFFHRVISAKRPGAPIVLAINKVDRVKEKKQLLLILEAWSKAHEFAAIVPVVGSRGGSGRADGLDRLLDEVSRLLPQSAFLFPDDEITDRPERFLAAELVREAVMKQTRDEIPYAIAVTIDEWEEPSSEKAKTRIGATIHVDKDAQRKIVVGSGGERIKAIGMAARQAIETTLDRRVHLGLYVHVEEGWASDDRKLAGMGYEPPPREG